MIGSMFNGYKILEKIGGGNTGVVYKGWDEAKQRFLALKILPNNFLVSKEKKARFMRETQAARILDHTNIARIYEIGECEGANYLAMEYVDGQSYSDIVESRPNGVRITDFYLLILPILDGMAYAHDRNLAHRDLKPDNLKLNSRQQPKVLDFGLVKFLHQPRSSEDSFQTMAGMVLGSAGYMSPEQAGGQPFDERTDVFSLGIIMYELLTGKNPFQGRNPFDTISKILSARPLSIELIRPDTPLPLSRIILKCLSKDMEARYANARAVQDAIIAVKGNP